MKYLLKPDEAENIKSKYKTTYISATTGLSRCYVSQIVNRKREVPKRMAYLFTKAINSELEIENLFELVR